MFFMVYLFLFLSVVGLAGVASNPSPNYAALSLVVVAGSGCGLLASLGSSFLSLILFLVYLGGMLVVFAYSIAFTNNFNTNNLGDSLGFGLFIILMPVVMICFLLFDNGLESEMLTVGVDFEFNSLVQDNVVSVGVLYTGGAGFLVFGSLALLVSLLVVLVVVRGSIPGGLRAV